MVVLDTKKHVVIVGGGAAGVAIAKSLAISLDTDAYTLTLINARDYYLHLVGGLRPLVTADGNLEKQILIPYDHVFDNGTGIGKVVTGEVVSVTKNKGGKNGTVVLASGEEIPWDILVLTPGNKWEGGLNLPPTLSEAEETIQEWRQTFKKAESIVLVGGGSVGIELAGELRDEYPDKAITIVHSLPHLMNDTYPVRYRELLKTKLTQRGVDVVLSDRVNSFPNPGPATIVTKNGTTLNTDLVVPTRGGRPNTQFLDPLFSSVLTSSGHIHVQQTLQVQSETNIFAAGDIIDWDEQHQVAKTYAHAATVTKNILAILNGEEAKDVYKGSMEAILVINGKNGGALYLNALWGLIFGDWAARLIKSRDLMIPKARKILNMPN